MIIISLILVGCVYVLTWIIDDKFFHKRNGTFIAALFMVISFLIILIGSAIVDNYLSNDLNICKITY